MQVWKYGVPYLSNSIAPRIVRFHTRPRTADLPEEHTKRRPIPKAMRSNGIGYGVQGMDPSESSRLLFRQRMRFKVRMRCSSASISSGVRKWSSKSV